jgi:hypothetical protein
MRRTTRIAVLVCVGALALAGAGQAFAAYAPKITASSVGAKTTIAFSAAPTDDPTFLLQFLVPAGFIANLGSDGQTIGTVDAKTAAADLGGATLPLTGTLQARASTGTYLSNGTPAPLAAAAAACTGTASHAAFWVLILSAAGQTLEVPIFVDTGPAGGPSYKLTLCLPPPDLPPGNPARATFGAKVFDATLVLNGVFTAPAGPRRWSLFAIPWVPLAGKPNLTGTVEAQSLDGGSVTVTLAAKRAAKKRATVSGRVTRGGAGVAGARVQIKVGKRVLATVTTSASGTFRATVRLPTGTATLTATATGGPRDLGASSCVASAPPVPCIAATAPGFAGTSRAVRVKT